MGEEHHLTAIARIGLSSALRAAGRTADAVEQVSRGRGALEAALDPTAPWALRARCEEAEALLAAGRAPEAFAVIAAAAQRAGSTPDANDAARILWTQVKALRRTGAPADEVARVAAAAESSGRAPDPVRGERSADR